MGVLILLGPNAVNKLFFPLLGLLLIFISFIPDLLLLGSPGIGRVQLYIIIPGAILCIIPFIFDFRPWTAIKTWHMRQKIGRKERILLLFSLVISATILDTSLRLALGSIYQATEFGWRIGSDDVTQQTVEDTLGDYRTVTVQYFEHDFKRWPNLHEESKTVLIIGDSFTHMYWVSNGEEWYAFLEKEFTDTEFVVFGGGGYGPLQEFLVLDKYIDEIKPDTIIWQFCDNNDYSDSFYELDKETYPHNNFVVRPYLENGEINYKLPLPFAFLRRVSFVADRLLAAYDRHIRQELKSESPEQKQVRRRKQWLDEQEMQTLFNEAFEKTLQIMTKVRRRVKATPIFLFNACGPISEHERRICELANLLCIEGLSEHVSQIEGYGGQLRIINDGHWNKEGNEVVGKWLVEFFKSQNVF